MSCKNLLITKSLTEFLDRYNGRYKEDDHVESEFRIFCVMAQRSDLRYDTVRLIAVDRHKFTLSQARKISKELKSIICSDDNYIIEYTGEIRTNKIKPYESTGEYKYLKFNPTIYIAGR